MFIFFLVFLLKNRCKSITGGVLSWWVCVRGVLSWWVCVRGVLSWWVCVRGVLSWWVCVRGVLSWWVCVRGVLSWWVCVRRFCHGGFFRGVFVLEGFILVGFCPPTVKNKQYTYNNYFGKLCFSIKSILAYVYEIDILNIF